MQRREFLKIAGAGTAGTLANIAYAQPDFSARKFLETMKKPANLSIFETLLHRYHESYISMSETEDKILSYEEWRAMAPALAEDVSRILDYKVDTAEPVALTRSEFFRSKIRDKNLTSEERDLLLNKFRYGAWPTTDGKILLGDESLNESYFINSYAHEEAHLAARKQGTRNKLIVAAIERNLVRCVDEGVARCVQEDAVKSSGKPLAVRKSHRFVLQDLLPIYKSLTGKKLWPECDELHTYAEVNPEESEEHIFGTTLLKMLQEQYDHDIYKELFRGNAASLYDFLA